MTTPNPRPQNSNANNPHRYDDIIHLARPTSKHPPIDRTSRAAQFAPFAALEGHSELVKDSESASQYERSDLELLD